MRLERCFAEVKTRRSGQIHLGFSSHTVRALVRVAKTRMDTGPRPRPVSTLPQSRIGGRSHLMTGGPDRRLLREGRGRELAPYLIADSRRPTTCFLSLIFSPTTVSITAI